MVLTGLKLGATTLTARYGANWRAICSRPRSLRSMPSRGREGRGHRLPLQARWHWRLPRTGHYQRFEASAEAPARDFDHKVRLVPRAELAAEIGSDVITAASVDDARSINPAQYVAGLARAARRPAQHHEGPR